jgi:hypothetical protein
MDSLALSDIGIKPGSDSTTESKEDDFVAKWLKEVEEAREREKDFRKEGNRINELYEGEKKTEYQFNILYSNTETMLPALYNSTPRPVVQRRFKDEDPLGKMASHAAQRTLEYLIDDGNSVYTSYDELLKSATLEALLPGRGVTRFKYDATFKEEEGATEEVVDYETVCGEEVPWDRFLHGQAKKWKSVPWVGFEHFMVKEELKSNFGAAIAAKIEVTEMVQETDDTEKNKARNDLKGIKVAQVFEIWDKDTKEVFFISPQFKSAVIKRVPDPLGLTGFFPCPKPLSFIAKITTLTPVALYTMYEEQAKELNRVTVRINKLIAAMKVRGMYDATVEGIDKVLRADDNVLIAAENVAALLANGNALERAIWLFPIEKLTAVLQQLYVQREQVKTTIYELTGIADIMRGSSQASETLGAQQIKNQWGTLRLKKTQKEVQRYARDCLRIMTEIAVTKLSPETLKAMTGLPYPTGVEKQEAQLAQRSEQQQAQMAQQMGQPAPPPNPQVAQVLSMPSWDEILGMLRDDTQRNYRIDIETNSTVDAEATEDKEDIGELLNAMSQFLSGIGPLVENGTMPFEVAQGMLLAVVRRYRFGPEMEDSLKKMKPPEQGASPEQVKQQAELQKQAEQIKQQTEQLKQQEQQALEKVRAEQMQLDMDRKEFEMQKRFAQKELDMEKQFAQRELDLAAQRKESEFSKLAQSTDLKFQQRESQFANKQAVAKAQQSQKGKA